MSTVIPPSSSPNLPLGSKPPNYLVMAILSTLCCFLPTGIAAIVFAAQVDSKWQGGDLHGAREASDRARLWSWISIGLGLAITVLYVVLGGLAATEVQY